MSQPANQTESYAVKIEQYQGPLDVLLQLIEDRELDITEISLAEICNAFIKHLDLIEERFPEELADFLVVATKLLYLKSRALLPYLEPDDEEESPTQLADRLRMYKEFRDAAEQLEQRVMARAFGVARSVRAKQLEDIEFSPPEHLTAGDLEAAYKRAVDRMDVVITLPKAAIKKAVTLKERITTLANLLDQHNTLTFNELFDEQRDRTEIVVTFLAVLELVKQRTVSVDQTSAYGDIVIHKDTARDLVEDAEALAQDAEADYDI